MLPRRQPVGTAERSRPRIAILIPAHNEEHSLPATLVALRSEVRDGDRIVVVADNCTDATASLALRQGAEVAERNDPARRGKGFAMDFGLRHLAANPPEVVVVIDADCIVSKGALDDLIGQTARTGLPAQALYLLEVPQGGSLRDEISAYAFMLKNQVRPTGLARLRFPCPLYGTGMAFPYPLLRDIPMADGNIVEDLQLGLNLVCLGQPPQFCPSAVVRGALPADPAAALMQRRRWEHGHVQTIVLQLPKLLAAAARRMEFAPLASALDLSIPPLSLLSIGVMLMVILTAIFARLGGSPVPLFIIWSAISLAFIALLATWVKFGRNTLGLASLLAIPFYVLWKVPMYLGLLTRNRTQWVRTARPAPSDSVETPASADPATSGTAQR